MLAAQGSLWDVAEEPRFDADFADATCTDLGYGAWLETVPGWVRGADALLDAVIDAAPWAGHERWMYDKVVSEPRLSTRGGTPHRTRCPR
ncbi:MAG: hypothetical protein WKF47_18945 [Geodermatophilaceae bacterium]